jgi:hypothetical protein
VPSSLCSCVSLEKNSGDATACHQKTPHGHWRCQLAQWGRFNNQRAAVRSLTKRNQHFGIPCGSSYKMSLKLTSIFRASFPRFTRKCKTVPGA